jgi:hypothetical protein
MMGSWDTAVYDALDCGREFDRFDVALPDTAATWLTKLIALRENKPEPPHPNAVGEMIAASAEPAAVDAAIAASLGAQHRTNQHGHAERLCAQRVLAAVLQDRDRLHRELAAVADELINRLHRVAAIEETIAELARERRVDEAALLANVEVDAATLKDLYAVRNAYTTPGGVFAEWSTGMWSCETWATPWDLPPHETVIDSGSLWELWRAGIRGGARLAFFTIEQAREQSDAHEPRDLEPIDPRLTSFA